MYLIHDEIKSDDPFYIKATELLQGESFLLTIQFPRVLGTQLINLRRMKRWVDLAANHRF